MPLKLEKEPASFDTVGVRETCKKSPANREIKAETEVKREETVVKNQEIKSDEPKTAVEVEPKTALGATSNSKSASRSNNSNNSEGVEEANDKIPYQELDVKSVAVQIEEPPKLEEAPLIEQPEKAKEGNNLSCFSLSMLIIAVFVSILCVGSAVYIFCF
ncbi:unnamed protein product, partial [Mesorhabditis spiculigera]